MGEAYNWNTGITDSITKAAIRTDSEKIAGVKRLIKEGKGNLYIVSNTGASWNEVNLIRIQYEKSLQKEQCDHENGVS